MDSEQAIEKEIQAKGLTAPRLTPDHINATIIAETFHVFPGTMLTVCVLTLRNGFTVSGESACASPANFNAEIGQKVAREKAREKIWMLEGYLLRERLHAQQTATSGARPQDPNLDGAGWRFETIEHGGAYPDTMPQAIRATDAAGVSCVYALPS